MHEKSKLIFSLRAEVSKDSWENLVLTEPNEILRKIESHKISVVFVFLNDLKHSVHVAHIPFLCRLSGTKLVVLKPGSAKELQSYFGSKNLFMFAVSKHDDTIKFSSHFSDIDPFNPNQLPQVSIKK